MMSQLGAPLGFMLSSALFAYFLLNSSSEDFLDWGWRFPFFVAFAINVVALFARLRLVATAEFVKLLETRELQPTGVFEMFRAEGRFVLIGAFAPLASFALFHVVTIFPLSYISLFTGHSAGEFLLVQFVSAMVGVATVTASGLIADRIGRRRLLAIGACLIGLYALLAPVLLAQGNTGEAVFVVVGFGLLGLSLGQSSGAVTSNFSTRYRYTGAALTSDLAWLIGAGFAPLVALSLAAKVGLPWIGAYLLSGAICTLAALAYNKMETR
jgi:MFS family permease